MSTDPKAILYYGIRLPDDWEEIPGEEEERDYDSINEQWIKPRRPPKPEDRSDYGTPEWDAWRAKNQAWEATPEYVEIAWSGAESYQTYYIHCPCLEKHVYWNDQIDLGRDTLLGAQPEADDYIRQFCEQFGLPFKPPSWHLASLYF